MMSLHKGPLQSSLSSRLHHVLPTMIFQKLLVFLFVVVVVLTTSATSQAVDDAATASTIDSTSITDRLVSYVLEPFEAAHDEAPVTEPAEAEEGVVMTAPTPNILTDLVYYSGGDDNVTISLSSHMELSRDSFVGNTSLRLHIPPPPKEVEDSIIYSLTSFAGINGSKVYACEGAKYLSFAYKTNLTTETTPSGLVGGFQWRISLYDDVGCSEDDSEDHDDCNTNLTSLKQQAGKYWEYHDPDHYLNGTDWQEVEIELNLTTIPIDLNRIKAWQLEWWWPQEADQTFSDNTTTTTNTTNAIITAMTKNTKTTTTKPTSLYLDHLRLVGGGELFGSGWTQVADHPYNPLLHLPQNSKWVSDANTLAINYTIRKYANWGGDVVFAYICPDRSYYNLSRHAARAMKFQYHQIETADPADRASLRFRVLDASHCFHTCNEDPTEMENYYAFSNGLKQPPGTRGTYELDLNTTRSTDLRLTGWYGILGNEQFDYELIKGYKYQFQINRKGEMNSTLTGMIEIGNLTILGPYPPGYDPSLVDDGCRIEDGIELAEPNDFPYLQYVGQVRHKDCCDACRSNPNCLYGMSSSLRACWLYTTIPANQLQITNLGFKNKDINNHHIKSFFWRTSVDARGEFCTVCDCHKPEQLIDCRNRNLTTIPMFNFTLHKNWEPKLLDLRENPFLTFLGEERISVFHNLRELRLPKNLAYLSENLLNKMEFLKFLTFEGEVEDINDNSNNMIGDGTSSVNDPSSEMTTTTSTTDTTMKSPFVNAIRNKNEAFDDICCGLGNEVIVPNILPSHSISYCNLIEDSPGVDSIYTPFTSYASHSRTIQSITPRSQFMSEAAVSAQTCAEYCHIRSDCNYFTFDSRNNRAEKICWLVSGDIVVDYSCCEDKDYEDVELGLPAYVSGIVPKARNLVDNARVLVSQYKQPPNNNNNNIGTATTTTTALLLQAHQDNQFTVRFYVSIGSMPLRGAVWVEPRLLSTSLPIEANITITPSRVILYDNLTTVPVDVTVENASELDRGGSITISHSVEACDKAFVARSSSSSISGTGTTLGTEDDLTVSISVIHGLVDKNHLGWPIRGVGYFLLFVIWGFAGYLISWTHLNNKERVVRASQPIFLAMICAGCIIMASAIFPLSFDDGVLEEGGGCVDCECAGCDVACNSAPWLLALGFNLVFASLFSKIWRMNRLVESSASFRRLTLSAMDVMKPLGVLVTLNVVCLSIWSGVDPMYWDRQSRCGSDAFKSYGRCQIGRGATSVAMSCCLLVINFCAVVMANYQAYKARNFSTEYSESKYIALAMLCIFQVSIVGIPLFFLVTDSPPARFFVEIGIITVVCLAVLLLLFLPKILALRDAKEKKNKKKRKETDTPLNSSEDTSGRRRSSLGMIGLEIKRRRFSSSLHRASSSMRSSLYSAMSVRSWKRKASSKPPSSLPASLTIPEQEPRPPAGGGMGSPVDLMEANDEESAAENGNNNGLGEEEKQEEEGDNNCATGSIGSAADLDGAWTPEAN